MIVELSILKLYLKHRCVCKSDIVFDDPVKLTLSCARLNVKFPNETNDVTPFSLVTWDQDSDNFIRSVLYHFTYLKR